MEVAYNLAYNGNNYVCKTFYSTGPSFTKNIANL
jgi:hypothetical protein